MKRKFGIVGALSIAALFACSRETVPPSPPPALPADLSAPPQETINGDAPIDRLIDCAGVSAALAPSDASASSYRAVLAAALARENPDAASLAARIEAARARWTEEPVAAQAARILVCQAEWPPAQP